MKSCGRLMATLCVLAGCAPESVSFELNFPSQDTFLHSEFVQVRAFLIAPEDLGACPSLLDDLRSDVPNGLVVDTGQVAVCDFLAGSSGIDSVGAGPHAWVAMVSNATNTVLLYGCSVAEVYDGAPPIEVELFMTDEYREAAMGDPPFSSPSAKCAE